MWFTAKKTTTKQAGSESGELLKVTVNCPQNDRCQIFSAWLKRAQSITENIWLKQPLGTISHLRRNALLR